MRLSKPFVLLITTILPFWLNAQNANSEERFQMKLDSLTIRIEVLHHKVYNAGSNRDGGYFATKRELDMTTFLREYEQLIYDEDLMQAQRLIDIKIKQSEKRADSYAINYYRDYQTKLTRLRGQKQGHYQQLFEKEKSFYKEYQKYIEPGTEKAYDRTLRMLSLAIKYAKEKGNNETLKYLIKYDKHTRALLLDLNNGYDLELLTKNEGKFLKVYDPLVEADSLKSILEGQNLVELCYEYSSLTQTNLDTNFFDMQKLAVANAIADWNERQGISTELASLTGQAIVARRDSINKEGIYQWNDLILVIGSLNFDSKTESIRKGEAIIDADRTLYKYMRVNKITNKDKKIELGKTYLLPVKDRDKVAYFRYDSGKQAWQYIAAYSLVISTKFTKEMGRFLPPLQFQDSISEAAE